MMGNEKLFMKLRKELEDAELAGNDVAEVKEVVVVNPFDEHGRMIPSLYQNKDPRHESDKSGSQRGKLRGKSTVDDQTSLDKLVQRERLGGESNIDDIHAKNIVRLGGRYKGTELGGNSASGMDEEDQVDTKMFETPDARMTQKMQKERGLKKAISESNKWDRIAQRCYYCFKSPQFKKHLLVSLGEYTYLALPAKPTLGNGHCIIVPLEHVGATNSCDEEVWNEIVQFKQVGGTLALVLNPLFM